MSVFNSSSSSIKQIRGNVHRPVSRRNWPPPPEKKGLAENPLKKIQLAICRQK